MSVKITASQVAALTGGRLNGPDAELWNLAGIKEAGEGDLTFLANPKYAEFLATTKASCILVPQGTQAPGKTVIECSDPYLAWAKVISFYAETVREKPAPGVHPTAIVDGSAKVDPAASIGPYVVIGKEAVVGPGTVIMPFCYVGRKASVGSNCLFYPNASLREECAAGNNVILHCGAVVGSDGFGYAKDGDKYFKIPQIGNVILEDDVEIGANATIDRGAFGPTVIKRGTKIDNLVQIAHNVEIGEDTAIAAQTGIAGSTKVGKGCVFAGQVGLVGHITIGDRVIFGAQAGVPKSIPSDTVVSGYPAIPHMQARRREASVAMLPEYIKKINRMEQRIKELEARLGIKADGKE
jgi:UDP-3-O-[3-hydroxymyristoyl] glucosamine N-acyltransferase